MTESKLNELKIFLECPIKNGSVMKLLMMLGVSLLADVLIFAFAYVISFIIGRNLDFSGNFPGLASVLTVLCTLVGYCLLKLLIFADRKLFGTTESGTKSAGANEGKFSMLMVVTSVIVYAIITAVHFFIFSVIDHRMYGGFILANPGLLTALFTVKLITKGDELLRKRIKTVLIFLFLPITIIAWWPIIPMLT